MRANFEGRLHPHDVASAKLAGECTKALTWALSPDKQKEGTSVDVVLSVAQKSIVAGANVDAFMPCRKFDCGFGPPIACAVAWQSEELLKLLLEACADVNQVFGRYLEISAVYYAAKDPQLARMLERLLDVPGIDLTRRGNSRTLLGTAVLASNVEAARLILPHVDPAEFDSLGLPALAYAVLKQCPDIVELLLLSQPQLDLDIVYPCEGHWTVFGLALHHFTEKKASRRIMQMLYDDDRTNEETRKTFRSHRLWDL